MAERDATPTMLRRLRDAVTSRHGRVEVTRGDLRYVVRAEWAHGEGFVGSEAAGRTREEAAAQVLLSLRWQGLL